MKNYLIALLIVISCTTCATYELSLGTLKERFVQIDSTDLKMVKVRGLLGERYSYLAHPSGTIRLIDKSGQPIIMEVKPSLEMRVTYDGGKRTLFYLGRP